MFAGCLQIMWAHSHLSRVEGIGYLQIIRAEKTDVCSSYELCLQAATATRENVLSGWMATENALRDKGLIKEANQVLEFIKNLPSVKTDHDLLKDEMLGDDVRLRAALNKKSPTVDKVVVQGDDLTPVR
jgi:hypothetical protein